jgi:hypothetical protein
MKGTFFNKPLEWNIETMGESWHQGDALKGVLRVKNHGAEVVNLEGSGVGLAQADIKKVQGRADGALKPEKTFDFPEKELRPGAEGHLEFTFTISPNAPVTDKKSSYYLSFGKNFIESQLQVKVDPKALFTKVVGLLDTFHRFKQKEYKAVKKGVEFKLIPPTSREMANVESLLLTFSMQEENLQLKFDFQVKKLDTSSVTTKINKESVSIDKTLTPKEYSLGRDMINQDQLLKKIEDVLSEVKMKNVF